MNAAAVEQFSYTFAGREESTLRAVSLQAAPGTLTVIAGHTGSGKSTLLRAIAGWLPRHGRGRTSGRVTLAGLDVAQFGARELAQRAGLVLQAADDQICATTVEAEIAFGLANLQLTPDEITRRIKETLSRFGLALLAGRRTAQLSGGEKQRLLIAAVMAMGPQLLVLDEPLGQLDPPSAARLLSALDSLRRDGVAVVVAEHRIDELLGIADQLVILSAAGAPQAVGSADRGRWTEMLASAGLTVNNRAPRGMNSAPAAAGPVLLEAVNLAFTRDASRPPLWRDVTVRARGGEMIALVGPNGSGKSTLLNVFAGLLRSTAGALNIPAGFKARARIGLSPQNPDLALFSATVRDELAFGPRQLGLSESEVARRVQDASKRFGLRAWLAEPPQALSRGERLRVAVAATWTMWPGVLMLDEPMTGQDPAETERLLESVSAHARGDEPGVVIFSTHDLTIAERFATRVWALAEGRLLADGPPAEVLHDERLLAAASLARESFTEEAAR